MKEKNEAIISLLEILASTSTKLDRRKSPSSTFNNCSVNLKLKLIHRLHNREKKYSDSLINIIKESNYIMDDLKILYVINYKCKLDQENTKRKIISNFKPLNVKCHNKKVGAYKNTEHINNLYNLYEFKYDLNI